MPPHERQRGSPSETNPGSELSEGYPTSAGANEECNDGFFDLVNGNGAHALAVLAYGMAPARCHRQLLRITVESVRHGP